MNELERLEEQLIIEERRERRRDDKGGWAERAPGELGDIRLAADLADLHLLRLPAGAREGAVRFYLRDIDYDILADAGRVDKTRVRLHTIDSDGRDTLLVVYGYTPHFYLQWRHKDRERARNEAEALVRAALLEALGSAETRDRLQWTYAGIERDMEPEFAYETLIAGVSVDGEGVSAECYAPSTSLFMRVDTAFPSLIPVLRHTLENSATVPEAGSWRKRIMEANTDFAIRFVHDANVNYCSWFNVDARALRLVPEGPARVSRCPSEYAMNFHRMETLKLNKVPDLRIAYLDIECETSQGFPDARRDAIITCDVKLRVGKAARHFFFMFNPYVPAFERAWAADVRLYWFRTEIGMLFGLRRFMLLAHPHVVMAHNGNNFDLRYINERVRHLMWRAPLNWSQIANHFMRTKVKEFRTKMSGALELCDTRVPGLTIEDSMVYLQRSPMTAKKFQLIGFSLGHAAERILGRSKMEMQYDEIPAIHKGQQGIQRLLELCRYNTEDSNLVDGMDTKLKISSGMEMVGCIAMISPQNIQARGVQYLVYSNTLRECMNYVDLITKQLCRHYIPTNMGLPFGREFKGAAGKANAKMARGYFTRTPINGMDFASLYPSIMMAMNLCFSTVLPPGRRPEDLGLADDDCHYFCIEGVDIYFVKPRIKEGVLPRVLRRMVQARKNIRMEGELAALAADVVEAYIQLGRGLELLERARASPRPSVETILVGKQNVTIDDRILNAIAATAGPCNDINIVLTWLRLEGVVCGLMQDGVKILNNSTYGATGVSSGLVACIFVAVAVTFYGRFLLNTAWDFFERTFVAGRRLTYYRPWQEGDAAEFERDKFTPVLSDPCPYTLEGIYGDTDSCYTECSGLREDQYELAFRWGAIQAAMVNRHIAYDIVKDPNTVIKMTHEKTILRALFPRTAMGTARQEFTGEKRRPVKKRYVIVIVEKLSDAPSIKRMGIESTRRDGCGLQRRVVGRITDMIMLENASRADIVAYLTRLHEDLLCGRIPISELIIAKSITKPLSEYPGATAADFADDAAARPPGAAEEPVVPGDEDIAGDALADDEGNLLDEDSEDEDEVDDGPRAGDKRERGGDAAATNPFTIASGRAAALEVTKVRKPGVPPHVSVARRLGGARAGFGKGRRVPYVVVTGHKNAKIGELARTPMEVLEQDLTPDYERIWTSQIVRPLEKLLAPFFDYKVTDAHGRLVYTSDNPMQWLHTLVVQATIVKRASATMRNFFGAAAQRPCMGCRALTDRPFCPACRGQRRYLTVYIQALGVAGRRLDAEVENCVACMKRSTGSSDVNIMVCRSLECSHYFTRWEAMRGFERARANCQRALSEERLAPAQRAAESRSAEDPTTDTGSPTPDTLEW